jgi:UDP:flavonoid glycosyltransferase YjiC (YdhE family)
VKVLTYTSPARGHLYPVVPIAAELARRGHGAAVCTLAGELDHLKPLGIEGSAIDPLAAWRDPLGAENVRQALGA